MNKISIYFNDNTYQIITNKIYSFLSNYVKDSDIQDKHSFLKEFKEYNKQEKFMSNIVPYNLDIYLNFPITEKDTFYYSDIFEELNFNKINLISNYNTMYLLYKNNTIKIYKYLLKEFINKYNLKKIYAFGNFLNNIDDNRIYIIDQPEDDVSQPSIKKNILGDFYDMSKNRQVIIITHNPQFIVNLDVDNVIFIGKDENDKIYIQNGALEYCDKDYDILKIVADNIEGGIDSINERWKRYDKNIYDV